MLRVLKQIIYGIFYLLIIGAISFGAYWLFMRPAPTCFDNIQNQNETGVDCNGPCISCELKNIKLLSVSSPVIFTVDNSVSLLFKITNPNLNYGVKNFNYKINLYDSGNNLFKFIQGNSFLYSQEVKDFIEAAVYVGGNKAVRAEAAVSDVEWIKSDQLEPQSSLEIENFKTTQKDNLFTVSGSIKNPNSFDIKKVVIGVIIVDGIGAPIGVTKTEINNLSSFEEKDFKVFASLDSFSAKEADILKTRFFIESRRR